MDLVQVIEGRRSHRSLEPVPIGDDLINDLTSAAQLAPSCMNNQPWRYVFVRDKEVLEEVFAALTRGNRWAKRASMVIAVVSAKDYDCAIGEREYFLFDTGMATALLLLRAHDLGLVAHPIAGFDPGLVKKALNIPEDLLLIPLLIVGKKSAEMNSDMSDSQKEIEKERPERLSFDEFAYMDRYSPSD
jgi:nitroreductase